jgi:chloramphenicol-sensitive protein RarD
MSDEREWRAGLGYGLLAYIAWGFFPIYWKQLQAVPSLQILAHRMVWSLLFVGVLLGARRSWAWLEVARAPRVFGMYTAAAAFLAINWGVYIYGVNAGYVVETSLGYFINPLINVVFGALFLGERLRRGQQVALGLAACGVAYLTWEYGQPPWIALTLAVTFAIYGLLKKKAPLGALEGLSVETAALFAPALGYLVWCHATGQGGFGAHGGLVDVMLLGGGVATAVPLICFAAAVRRLTLTAIGVLQYLAPTLQFLLGVFLYGEDFSLSRLVGFVFIWTGLVLFTAEGVWKRRRGNAERASGAKAPLAHSRKG